MEPEAVHDFGNNLRSKHRSRAGEFTMFADDDNLYAPDALPTVRTVVHHDSDALCEGTPFSCRGLSMLEHACSFRARMHAA